MHWRQTGWLVGALAWVSAAPLPAEEDVVPRAVVKIHATLRTPEYFAPWMKSQPKEISGSGVIIAGNRILTNAHIAMHGTQIFVQGRQSSDRIPAEVEAIGPGIDLAVLKVADPAFFTGIKPIEFYPDRPKARDAVTVLGFPEGGNSLSVTKGIISRIEYVDYGFASGGLRIQIDAAINRGNSGGPAVVGDRLVGLAFSRLQNADNIGYLIPVEEIQGFLDDIADGKFDGKPLLLESMQTLENPALREQLKLTKDQTGLMVNRTRVMNPHSVLHERDVLMKIGPHRIDNLGQVEPEPGFAVRLFYLVQKLAVNEKLPVTVLREGKVIELQAPLARPQQLVMEWCRERPPEYFICGPLCFSPAYQEHAEIVANNKGGFVAMVASRRSPLLMRRLQLRQHPDEQLVIVSAHILPNKIGKGYSDPLAMIVHSVNGVEIKNLAHLVEFLRDCKDPYLEFRYAESGSEVMVFKRDEMVSQIETILEDNGIRQQASERLLKLWRQGK